MLRNKRNLGVLAPIIRDFEDHPKRIAYALHRGKVVKCWLVGLEANYAIEDNKILIKKSIPVVMNLLMDTFKEQRKTDEWIQEFAIAVAKAFSTDVTPILDKRAELDEARAAVEAKEQEIATLKASLETKEEPVEDDPPADNKYGVKVEDIDNFSEDELLALGAEMNMDVNKIIGSDDDFTALKDSIAATLELESALDGASELPSSGLIIGQSGVVERVEPFDFKNANKDQLLEYGYTNQVEGIKHSLNTSQLMDLIETHEQTKQKSK